MSRSVTVIAEQTRCTSGKIIYWSLHEASQAGVRLSRANRRRQSRSNRRVARAYRCPECSGFHLATDRKRGGWR